MIDTSHNPCSELNKCQAAIDPYSPTPKQQQTFLRFRLKIAKSIDPMAHELTLAKAATDRTSA
jgi:hypothetical protein